MNPMKGRDGRLVSPVPPYLFLMLAATATLLLAGGTARADHPAGDESISAVLDEKSPALEGITVQVQDTQGAQLVVENETQKRLEVYDAEGEPFLRIGPGGVEANRSAEAFYETYGPRGVNAPEGIQDEQPADWQRISDESSWGWFDRRLRSATAEVPERLLHAEEAGSFGSWKVPVSLGEDEVELRGSYRYEPEPSGAYLPALTSEPEEAGIEAQLSQGYGGPSALFVRNSGEEPVTVLDASGVPALRIGPEEVQANLESPVGREASRVAGSSGTSADKAEDTGDVTDPEWRTVSGGSSFTWQDPRLRPPGGADKPPDSDASEPQEVARWEIPLEISGESYGIEGVIEWQPLQSEATTGSSGHDHSNHDHSNHDHSNHDHSNHDHPEARSSPGEERAPEISAATVVPVAGLLVAVSAGGALLYRRWRG